MLNYRHSTNHQVVIDADTRLVVAVGRPLPDNRNDCKAWELSGAKDTAGRTTVIADGGLLIPHRREPSQTELPAWKEEHNRSHRKVRTRVEHAFARMKTKRAGFTRWLAAKDFTNCWKASRDADTESKEEWLAAKRAAEQEGALAWARTRPWTGASAPATS